MQQTLREFNGLNISYHVGSEEVLADMQKVSARKPFDAEVVDFLNAVSRELLSDKSAKQYPDVVTLAFWIRKASVENLKKRFSCDCDSVIRMGRGTAFHIAPSNVPVNYAYSLFTGLICGNKNVVRIPSKDFPQVDIINKAINKSLDEYSSLKPYICLVKYGHDEKVNDSFSDMADLRIIWGGDNTISDIRKSELRPRATEITFADRYSLAVIDSDEYMGIPDKKRVANDFYNDTYLTDQNACTSPKVVVWTGECIDEVKDIFWNELYNIVKEKYAFSDVQAVNKLTSGYMAAVLFDDVKKVKSPDNYITRINVVNLSHDLMEVKDNSGYFYEYDCKDILELYDFCNDTGCQTIAHIGNADELRRLAESGISGVDRIVPVGKTMDFDFLWDGYNLFERMTRNIVVGN